MYKSEPDKDINEVFEDIFFSEENIINESYQEGLKLGTAQGNTEGYHLGYHRGAEIGSEIGFYTGIVESYLNYYKHLQDQPEKIIKSLEALQELLDKFPKSNVESVDILEEIKTIRVKFKKLCAQMKNELMYPETNKLSF